MNDAYMREALAEAEKAYSKGEVPIGAVIVQGEEVIARGHNLRETNADPTAHAEIVAMREAAKVLGGWRLSNCRIYVTIEPCPMCAGACVNARIDEVIYGAPDIRAGACHSIYSIPQDARLNHRCVVTAGVLEDECVGIMRRFFRERRMRPVKK